jgi:hypothetical protein
MISHTQKRPDLESRTVPRISRDAALAGANPLTASDWWRQATQPRWMRWCVSRANSTGKPPACDVPKAPARTVGKTVAAERRLHAGLPRQRHSPGVATERVVLWCVRARGGKRTVPQDVPAARSSLAGGDRMRGPAHSGKLARSAVRRNCREAFRWATVDRCSALPSSGNSRVGSSRVQQHSEAFGR